MPQSIMEHPLSIRDGVLYFEDCSVIDLALKFGTPVFAVSENQLRRNYLLYKEIYERRWPEGQVRIMPSLKACPIVAVRRILSEEGAGCDVFGAGELECAIRGNVRPSLISVNGSIKDHDLIQSAISIGARIVLDSPRELTLCENIARRLGKTARVMFRLKPNLSDLNTISDYAPDYTVQFMTQVIKYGIPNSELVGMAKDILDYKNVELVGVHVHMGRHSKKLEVWRSWVENTVKLVRTISEIMGGWRPQIINLGGGMPSRFDFDTDVTTKGYDGPSPEQLADEITSTLRRTLAEFGISSNGLVLEIEPGRALHCDTGIHFTTVRNIKTENQDFNHSWAEVDTSQMFLGVSGSNFLQPKFKFVVANKAAKSAVETTDIVGMTCNLEVLFYQVATPSLEIGDIIALLHTGSYIEPCTQNFNALPRPGTILVNEKSAEWVKRAETVEDVFRRDLIPERFCGEVLDLTQQKMTGART